MRKPEMKRLELRVLSVNLSADKGTAKLPLKAIELNATGVAGDAHAGNWQRQVSLLAAESIKRFSKEAGREIGFGEFAENITTSGIELKDTLPLDRFLGEKVELEVTQIGKKCHGSSCAIYQEAGNCVMPLEGIFARVVRGGKLKPGDLLFYEPKTFKIMVVTLSDRASTGGYPDKSGPAVTSILQKHFEQTGRKISVENLIIPDDGDRLKKLLGKALEEKYDMVFTTGGTGIGPRDITPDIVRPMLDKEIPGIMEMIRMKYGTDKPNALLSRGVAGVMNQTLVYTLPGSVSGVTEYMNEIPKTLEHLIYMLHGIDAH